MQTILITGATSGFGLATARILSKDHKLILVARRKEKLDELKKELGENVHIASVDVTNKDQVAKFFEGLPEGFRDVGVLVNNAGLALGLDTAQESNLENWERMVDTNIKGMLIVARHTLDIMAKRGSGLIINIGSMASNVPYRGGNVYGATKAFVRHFSRNLRTDLFGTGIKVTNLEPGAAHTEFAAVRFDDTQKGEDFYDGWKPLEPEDIASAIAWVMSQPPHVNIENIEIMPLDQTYAGLATNKETNHETAS